MTSELIEGCCKRHTLIFAEIISNIWRKEKNKINSTYTKNVTC